MARRPNCSSAVSISRAAEGNVRRFWLRAFAVGAFFFGYYYYYWTAPTLLPAGAG